MNKILIFITGLCLNQAVLSQEITGDWNGVLNIQGVQLSLVFHISQGEEGLEATMDSPDQGAYGIPVTQISFEDKSLLLEIENAGITYKGELINGEIQGIFSQAGREFPLNLSKQPLEQQKKQKKALRPQEPQKPYPYYVEEVSFNNTREGIELKGTLTMPEERGNFPAVILISGSGPQNRDEEIFGHKPFLVISDYLTRNGIAVLRFDERGTGESQGSFHEATTFDFATDVEYAMDYLLSRNEIDHKDIGLIGHSEGGMVAPIVASGRPEDTAFIVLLAAPGFPGDELLFMQQRAIGRASGLSEEQLQENMEINKKLFQMIKNTKDDSLLVEKMTRYLEETLADTTQLPSGMNHKDFISMQVRQLNSPWMRSFLSFDPASVLKEVECPVLALNGGNDLQVPAEKNLEAIEKAVKEGGNFDVTTILLPGLNHLFQESETGLPDEYGLIEQTFAPAALEIIGEWITKKTNRQQ